MRPSQSCFVFRIILIQFVLYVMSQSSDELDFGPVGLPTGHTGGASSARVVAVDASDVAIPGGANEEEADSDLDFAGGANVKEADSDLDFAVAPPTKRRRAGKPLKTSGTFWAFVSNDMGDKGLSEVKHVLAGIVKFEWLLTSPDFTDGNINDCGTLEYIARRVVIMDDGVRLPDDFQFSSPVAALRAQQACRSCALMGDPTTTVGAFLSGEKIRCDRVLDCSPDEFDMLCNVFDSADAPARFRILPVHKRKPLAHSAIWDAPSRHDLRRWRAAQSAQRGRGGQETLRGGVNPDVTPSIGVDHLLYLPPWADLKNLDVGSRSQTRIQAEIDPIKLVDALAVVQHLRTPRDFSELLDDAGDYLAANDSLIVRNREADPARTSLQLSLARADLVAMLLQRRWFRKWRQEDSIRSIHIYSDASPVVGHELQGMILDICFNNGDVIRMILPGSTLAYGHADTMSKGVALLHALWLVAGATESDLAYVCSKVRSLTTDFGVEMHLLEMPDLIAAYIAFLGGAPLHRLRSLVNNKSRLFGKAMRIAGWSHTLGGIMKMAAEIFPQFPSYLVNMRALCKFFKNPSYRQHIERRLGKTSFGEGRTKKQFTATFAKWRYETMVDVLQQLAPLRKLCEEDLDEALFAKAQDPEFIKAVMRACRDSPFWRWAMASLREIFLDLEVLRKWGMVCGDEDCEELRKASGYKKKIDCPRNSRRLRHAATRVDEAIEKFRKRASQILPTDTDDDRELCSQVQSVLRVVAEYLDLRFKYLKSVPWSFVRADTQEGAANFLEGAKSRPLSEHDELTCYLFEMYRQDLEDLALTGECSTSLADEVEVFNAVPLDESAGEGYHRSTHHTLIRASGAKSPYIKESVRRKGNIKLLRYWRRLGQAGQRVLRFEWRNAARILQVHPRRLWRPCRMKRQRVLERVYRMDAGAEFDWTLVGERILAPGQGAAPKEKTSKETHDVEGMRVEYLLAVLKPLQWYCIDVPKAALDEEGRPVEVVERKHFQVLERTHGKSRPSLMPTIDSHREVSVTSRLALSVQEVSQKPDVVVAEGCVLVFPDGEAQWRDWRDLGPFASVRESLLHFRRAEGFDSHPGCILLIDPERAVPTHAVTDMKCPALTMLAELYRRGWRTVYDTVQHVNTTIGLMDAREAVRCKAYYVVLMKIDECMPLTSRIPSDQPIAFYNLLLQGRAVEPGLGNKTYLAICRDKPLPTPAPLEDDDDIDFSGQPRRRVSMLGDGEPGSEEHPRGSGGSRAGAAAPKAPLGPSVASPGHGSGASSSSHTFVVAPALPPGKARAVAKAKVGAPAKAKTPKAAKAKAASASVDPTASPPPEIDFAGPAGDAAHGGAPPVPVVERTVRTPKKFVNAIGLGRVNFMEYPDKHTGKIYANWTFVCPHHHNCQRVMGTGRKNTTPHGALQPLAYLHVWRDTPPDDRTHRLTPADDRAVTTFFNDHEAELTAIWDQFASP